MIVNIETEVKIAQQEPSDLSTWDWSDTDDNTDGGTIRCEVQTGVGLKFPHRFSGRTARIEAYFDTDTIVRIGSVVRIRFKRGNIYSTAFTGRVTSFHFRVQGASHRYTMDCAGIDARAGVSYANVLNSSSDIKFSAWIVSPKSWSNSIFKNTDDLFPVDVLPANRNLFLGAYTRTNNTQDFISARSLSDVLRQISAEFIQPSMTYEDGRGRLVIEDPIELARRPSDASVKNLTPLSASKVTRVNRLLGNTFRLSYNPGTRYMGNPTIRSSARFGLNAGWNRIALSTIDDDNFKSGYGYSSSWFWAVYTGGTSGVMGGIFADGLNTTKAWLYLFAETAKTASEWTPTFQKYKRTRSTGNVAFNALDALPAPASDAVSTTIPYYMADIQPRHLGVIKEWGWNSYIASTYGSGVDRVECTVLANDDDMLVTPGSLEPASVITVSDYDDGNTRLRVKRVRWIKRNDGIMTAEIVADADCLAP